MRFVTVRPRYPVGAKISGYPAISEVLVAEPGFEAYALQRDAFAATLLVCLTGPSPRPADALRRWYEVQRIAEFGITESTEFGVPASNAVLRVRGRWMADASGETYDPSDVYALLFALVDLALAAKRAGTTAAMARRYVWSEGPPEDVRLTSIGAGIATDEFAVVRDLAETFVWAVTGIALDQSTTTFAGADVHKWCEAVDEPLSHLLGRALAKGDEGAMALEDFRLAAGAALASAHDGGRLEPRIVERYASVGPFIARYDRR